MCTCIDYKSSDKYFGRTLDLEYHYNEEVVITPNGFTFSFQNGDTLTVNNAIIGMATVINDYPLYYEATNESGLSMAGLYFPGNAEYSDPEENKLNLSPFELIPYFLGKYSSLQEMAYDLEKLNITNIGFSPDMPLSPLHFMISDSNNCIVMEQTKSGLHIYDNPARVMTNNPPFKYQLETLSDLKDITPEYKESGKTTEEADFECVGGGAYGLPGDYTSTSRFLKAVFLNATAEKRTEEEQNVSQFFHILDQVSMIRGSVRTRSGKNDMTVYACCCNTDKGIYYYKTYDNSRINAVRLTDENKYSFCLTRYPVNNVQDINYQN